MKKILVISVTPVPPIHAGNQKCIMEYCNILKKIGCTIYFLYIEGRHRTPIEMHSYWGDHLFIYKKKMLLELPKRMFVTIRAKLLGHNYIDDLYPIGLTKYVRSIQKKIKFDGIIINYLILSKLFNAELKCRKFLFAHDCMTFKKAHLGVTSFWFDLTPNQEAKGLQRCETILSIQENESVFFQYLHPKGHILTVYSSFKVQRQPIIGNKNILFLSGTSTLNINGLNFFINKIFPLVLQKEPEAKLIIGGSICDVLPKTTDNSIVQIGKVESAEQFYALGDIAINPVYQGTGLKIKTFEALSYGKVTIVHPHSAEGIYNKVYAPIIQGETPISFANHLVEVLSNVNIRKEYSDKAIEYICSLNEYIEMQYRKMIAQ